MAQKKTFLQDIENPAEFFISSKAEAPAPAQTEEATAGKAPEGYHANPLYIENKSKRLQLLTKPSTAEKLRAKAQREGRSVNDIVNTILEEALREE